MDALARSGTAPEAQAWREAPLTTRSAPTSLLGPVEFDSPPRSWRRRTGGRDFEPGAGTRRPLWLEGTLSGIQGRRPQGPTPFPGRLDDAPQQGFFDELFEAPGPPARPRRARSTASLERMGPDGLAAAADRRDAIFVQQGITFEASGEDGPVKDRPFPLDLIPRIMPAAEWRTIKRGVAQRVRALNRFVEDVYHERGIVREGIVPWELVVTRPNFARAAHRIRPPGGVWCHVSGCDLVRDVDGRGRCWRTTCARRPASRTCWRTGSR